MRPPPPRSTLFPYTTLFRSGVTTPGIGVETIQDRLTPETAAEIARNRGEADLLIVRHILEHAHQPLRFLEALTRSEEHTSELQSHVNLVCRLLLEKKNSNDR